MRDSQPFWFRAASCRLRPLRHRFAPWRLRQCLLGVRSSPLGDFFSFPPISSNIQTKTRDFPAILRQNNAFIKIVPGIYGHFRALKWTKWIKSPSISRQYRYFARQSDYAHSPLPDIPDISAPLRCFAKTCWHFSSKNAHRRPSTLSPPTH